MRKSLAVILILGLLVALAVPAFAAEGTDYDALFAEAAEDGEDPLIDALIDDPAAFLEALAFQSKEVQHTVIYTMADGAGIDEWTVLRYLINWATEDRELTESETNTIAALRYAINYEDYAFLRAYKSGEELDALMKESLTSDGWYSEWLSNVWAEAIKGDAIGFVRTFAAQEEKVQQRVLGQMPYHCTWTLGNVLIDILKALKTAELTDAEAAAVDALLAELAETPAPVVAVDPDPKELAAYLAKRGSAQQEPSQEPEPTQPETTRAPTESPAPTEPTQEGISAGWLVLVPVGFAAGFLAGRMKKKKEI